MHFRSRIEIYTKGGNFPPCDDINGAATPVEQYFLHKTVSHSDDLDVLALPFASLCMFKRPRRCIRKLLINVCWYV